MGARAPNLGSALRLTVLAALTVQAKFRRLSAILARQERPSRDREATITAHRWILAHSGAVGLREGTLVSAEGAAVALQDTNSPKGVEHRRAAADRLALPWEASPAPNSSLTSWFQTGSRTPVAHAGSASGRA